MKVEKPKIQNLDPHTLEIPEVRIDSAFEDDILAMFADDVKKTGIEQALIIGKDGDHLWVIDGRHRLEQALINGFPSVPCIVREMDMKAIQIRNLVSNRLRGKTKVSEEIKVIGDLYNNHGATIDEIVERTGMKRDRLETMILISKGHPAILKALDDDQISVAAAAQLIRLPGSDHQSKMLSIALQYRPKAADLRDWVDTAVKEINEMKKDQAGSPPPGPPPVPSATCSCCGQLHKLTDLTAPTLCRPCYATLISAHQELQKLEAEDRAARATGTGSQNSDPGTKGGGP